MAGPPSTPDLFGDCRRRRRLGGKPVAPSVVVSSQPAWSRTRASSIRCGHLWRGEVVGNRSSGHVSAGLEASRVTYVDGISSVRNFRRCGPLPTKMNLPNPHIGCTGG
jgi:hypothetical protein